MPFVKNDRRTTKQRTGTTTRTNRVAGNIIFEEYFNASDWSAASVDGVAVPANMPAGWVCLTLQETTFLALVN